MSGFLIGAKVTPCVFTCSLTGCLPRSLTLTPFRALTQPNGQPAPVPVYKALEPRAQLVVTCSAPQFGFFSSSCCLLGYVWGKSQGEVGAASTLSQFVLRGGPVPQMSWGEEDRRPWLPSWLAKVSLGRVGWVGTVAFPQ